jgi:hypothetical protein
MSMSPLPAPVAVRVTEKVAGAVTVPLLAIRMPTVVLAPPWPMTWTLPAPEVSRAEPLTSTP